MTGPAGRPSDAAGRPAIEGARFGHTNLTGRDWRALATFYADVFGCVRLPPERDYRGPDLDAATALHDAHLTGAHLLLPGHGEAGPTLEIYQYDELRAHPGAAVDRPGWGHIAFGVPDVRAARDAVVAAGGGTVGDVVTLTTTDGRHVTWCYATDPEGNIVELQAWA
jgi:predicted enzyme related to lactoylglutathione lyase